MNNNNDKNRQDPNRQGQDQGRNEKSGQQRPSGDKATGQQRPAGQPGQEDTNPNKIKKGF